MEEKLSVVYIMAWQFKYTNGRKAFIGLYNGLTVQICGWIQLQQIDEVIDDRKVEVRKVIINAYKFATIYYYMLPIINSEKF